MGDMSIPGRQPPRPAPGLEERGQDLERLLVHVAQGDHGAFEVVYERMASPVYGLVRKVVRDLAQSEEVTQEALLDVWRCASRFDAARGSAANWVMTIAHRRAVDRVRSTAASAWREHRTAPPAEMTDDEVAEAVQARLDAEQMRRCLDSLTTLQRESILLAYYGGRTHRQAAEMLGVALGTIKTRIRDGLIRMRDCMGVKA